MPLNVAQLEGITPELAKALKVAGLENSRDFLEAADTPTKRRHLSKEFDVPSRTILELANRADLARIHGIGKVFSDLLEYAGVDTVAELAQRNPEHLHAKILEVAAEYGITRIPRDDEVDSWVYQAKQLDRAIFY